MNRRQFLAGAGSAAVGSLAGCSSSGDGESEGGDSISDWTVADDLAPSDDYEVWAASPARLDEYGTEFVEERFGQESWVDVRWREFDFAEIDVSARVSPRAVAGVGSYAVLEGTFDAGDVVDDITAYNEAFLERPDVDPEEYDVGHAGSHAGYELYDVPSKTVAVRDGRVLDCLNRVADGSDVQSDVERILDTVEDDATTVVDGHDGLATVADRIEDGVQWGYETVDPSHDSAAGPATDGRTAFGRSESLDGEESTRHEVWAFESADRVEEAAVEAYVENLRESGYEDVEHEVDGDVLDVTATGPAEEVFVPTYVVLWNY